MKILYSVKVQQDGYMLAFQQERIAAFPYAQDYCAPVFQLAMIFAPAQVSLPVQVFHWIFQQAQVL